MFNASEFFWMFDDHSYLDLSDQRSELVPKLHKQFSNHLNDIVCLAVSSTHDLDLILERLSGLLTLAHFLKFSQLKMDKAFKVKLHTMVSMLENLLFYHDPGVEWKYGELPVRCGVAVLEDLAKNDSWNALGSNSGYKEFLAIKADSDIVLSRRCNWLYRQEGF